MPGASSRRPASLALFAGVGERTPAAERRFFDRLRMPNGTWKTTYARRLDDLNAAILPFVAREGRARCNDVAISSGVSTVEWSDQLTAAGVEHELVAGDLCVGGWLASIGTAGAVVYDERDEPLLLELGPLSLPVQSSRSLARLARPVLVPALRALARAARARGAPAMAPARARRLVHRPIPLVVPELAERPDITLVTDDLLAPATFPEPFDVVRAANILHRAYFDDATLARMVANLRARLRDGGVLAICRTHEDGRNDATIFRRSGGELEPLATLGAGTEILELVRAA